MKSKMHADRLAFLLHPFPLQQHSTLLPQTSCLALCQEPSAGSTGKGEELSLPWGLQLCPL